MVTNSGHHSGYNVGEDNSKRLLLYGYHLDLNSEGKKPQPSSGSYPSSNASPSHTSSSYSSLSSLKDILRSHTFLYYTLIPALALSVIAILSTNLNAWRLSEFHHFYIELFAVILGSILAFYYIARAHALNDNFSRFVGYGFLVSALIDSLHVIISFAFMNNVTFLKYFIPQTWFAGRIFLSAMLVIAIVKYPTFSGEESDKLQAELQSKELKGKKEDDEYKHEKNRNRMAKTDSSNVLVSRYETTDHARKTFLTYLTVLTILAGTVAISSLNFILPFSVVDQIPLHRPYELPSLVLFVIALVLFYKNQLYKKTDVLYKGILAYLIIDIYAQIIMSYSATSFDTPHMVAHILKDAGYFVNIIALALSSVQYNVRLRESNKSLIESNVRLKEREELIRIQYDQVKESERMKDEFINVAAHELRTPIQPILGLTDIIRSKIEILIQKGGMLKQGMSIENPEKSEQLLNLLNVITRNGKRLKQLTDNILDVTKIESHAMKLSKSPTDIRLLIEDTVRDQSIFLNEETVAKTRIDILCRTGGSELMDETWASFSSSTSNTNSGQSGHEVAANSERLGSNTGVRHFTIDVDRAKISQVITNLLSNALMAIRSRHDNAEGRIIIFIKSPAKEKNKNYASKDTITPTQNESKELDEEIIVSVKDNGIGIPPGVFQDLFQKFVTRFDSGTGLGLYIARNIVEGHGGRIWANNNTDTEGTAVGPKGATFSFSLPISRERI